MGDVIDARDLNMGAWFESKIQKVTKSTSEENSSKVVLSETTQNSVTQDVKDKKESVKTEETEKGEGSSLGPKPYHKLRDIVKDDGFTYHIVYDGSVQVFLWML